MARSLQAPELESDESTMLVQVRMPLSQISRCQRVIASMAARRPTSLGAVMDALYWLDLALRSAEGDYQPEK
ncbi:hypothetical protein [Microbulbifer sp. VVAC002]|uniref:hypothetical protein n=1 Tax=Microbulbifer sp. VVAC002 TaxID=3243387 RepID=UPI002B2FEE1A|nr:hypothetical protein QT397_14750 [Microbulbifer sp. MKSA007]